MTKSCCAGVALCCVAWLACAPVDAPPSILLVTLDTLRVDHVGAYANGAAATPALDALAAEGLVHEHAYTTMPITGPAHISLFTGLQPSEHGSQRNGQPLALSMVSRSLVGKLAEAGYATAAFTATSLLSYRFTGLSDFDVYDAPDGSGAGSGDSGENYVRSGRETVEAALAWLQREDRRPVFLWVHLYDAHAPYGSSDDPPGDRLFDWSEHGWVDTSRYPDAGARTRMRQRYAEGVREMDRAVGRLVGGVRRKLRRPPLVIVVADHGEALDEHLDARGYAYDHGEFLDPEAVSIPLLLAGPGVAPGRSTQTVSIRDVYTAILEAAGIGDPIAAQEGRRNLQRPSDAKRAVGIERRAIGVSDRNVVAFFRFHAGAAAEGRRLVVVGEDGSATLGKGDAELLGAARERAAAVGRTEILPDPDEQTLKTLRALGYVE